MYHKHKARLRRILAGILSAAMIFTTDGQVLTAAAPSAMSSTEVTDSAEESMTALAEDTTVSDDAATADGADISADDAADPAVSAGDAMTLSGIFAKPFTLTPADIQYGEDGSNRTGNLDALFAPRFVANDSVLTLKEDYTVTYKFFTGDAPASPEAFAEAEGVPLETIPAGTKVTVCALADTLSDAAASTATGSTAADVTAVSTDAVSPAADLAAVSSTTAVFASATFTVQKRKVVIHYTVPRKDVLDGREVPEDGQLVIPQADILPGNLTVSVSEDASADSSFAAADDLNAALAEAIEGDLTLDVSAVDVTADGYQVVPADFTLAPSFDDNYEIVGNIFGDIYVKKAKYYVTFTVNNEGEQWSATYEQDPSTQKAVNTYSFYSQMRSAVEALLAKSEDTELVGWSIYTDSHNVSPAEQKYGRYDYYCPTFVNSDASTYEYGGETKTFLLSCKNDYHFVAQVRKPVAEKLYVTTIPSVYYDGHAHVSIGSKVNARKQSADLRLAVYTGDSYAPLTPGKDYTLTYANNVNASMKLVRDASGKAGSYVKAWTQNEERPKVTITGKGLYKGISAVVYFDILPVSLGATEDVDYMISAENSNYSDSAPSYDMYTSIKSSKAELSGFAVSYQLNAASKIKNPKVTKEFYTYSCIEDKLVTKPVTATVTLKEGTDYELEFYRFDAVNEKWVPASADGQNITRASAIKETGDYLCVVRGIGNYCGAVYDTKPSWADEQGVWFDYFNPDSPADAINPSLNLTSPYQFKIADNYDHDFSKIKISIGKKSLPFALTESNAAKKYDAGADGFNITAKYGTNTLTYGTDYHVFFQGKYRGGSNAAVSAADEYAVWVYPAGDWYGTGRLIGKVKITGLKLKSGFFTLNQKSVAFGEIANYTLTDKGRAVGLGTSSYYIIDSWIDYAGSSPYSASKVTYVLGGSDSGEAIDPSSSVKLSFTRKAMSLQDATKTPDSVKPYIRFEIAAPTAQYSIKGAMPEIKIYYLNSSGTQTSTSFTLDYNGYTRSVRLYDAEKNILGYEYLTFKVKNNTKVGRKATVTVIGKGIFKGTVTIGEFEVIPKNVSNIYTITSLSKIPYSTSGRIYAVFTDGQYGKGNLNKPNVKLYQSYYNNKGQLALAPLGKNQYAVATTTPDSNAHGCSVTFNSPSGDYVFPDSIAAYYYALYDSAKLPAVKSVTINGTKYTVTKNHIDGYAPAFTGTRLYPEISEVELADSDGTVLKSYSDYNILYPTSNIAMGTGSGSITITTKYNSSSDRYPYKGKVTLKFDIVGGTTAITL